CSSGGSHHPPALLGSALFGGQKFVAMMMMDVPKMHHSGSEETSHPISKHPSQLNPLLKTVVLNAVVLIYKSPPPKSLPNAPPRPPPSALIPCREYTHGTK
ncbi:hypothetical protein KP509_20G061400, partial [Ceratopteris richardii]